MDLPAPPRQMEHPLEPHAPVGAHAPHAPRRSHSTPLRVPRARRSGWAPALFVLGVAAGPLVAAACGEPGPPASAPNGGNQVSTDSTSESPATPPSFASALAAIPKHKVGDSLSKEECEQLYYGGMRARMVPWEESRSCTADSDCGHVSDVFCGVSGCNMPIAKSAEAKYRADFARVEKATCPAWREGGCPQKAPVPVPSCVPSNPKCVNGQCDFAN